MHNPCVLDLDVATVMVDAAKAYAADKGWPVSIAVVDQMGGLVTFARMDRASVISTGDAIGKARAFALSACLSNNCEIMFLEGRISLWNTLHAAKEKGCSPVYINGQMIGAIGVSGESSVQVELVAQIGADVANVVF